MYSADPVFQKAAAAAFFDELATLLVESRSKLAAEILDAAYDDVLDARGSEFVKQASDDDLEGLVKVAVIGQLVKRFPALGMPAGQGLRHVGSQAAAGMRSAGQALTTGAAGRLASSQGEFARGMGQSMQQHLTHSPVMSRVGLPGTYAAGAAQSAAQMGRRGMIQAGGRLANTAPAGSLRARIGEGLVNAGTSNAMGAVVNKAIPTAAHLGGNMAAAAAGLPMAGALAGKAAVGLGGKVLGAGAAKVLGAGVADAAGHAVGEALHHGAGHVVGHAAQDVVGDHLLVRGGHALKRLTPARGLPAAGAAPQFAH